MSNYEISADMGVIIIMTTEIWKDLNSRRSTTYEFLLNFEVRFSRLRTENRTE